MVALIAVPLSMTLGLLAAMYPGTRLDRAVTFTTLGLISVPEFLVATFLVLVVAVYLGWLPATAYMSGNETGWQLAKALAMPTLTLVIVASSQIMRMTRATVLNVMSSPYIEMAILKGVPRSRIILRHALFNAIGPIVNVVALNLAYSGERRGHRRDDLRLPRSRQADDRRRTDPGPAAGAGLRHDLLRDLHRPDLHRGHGLDPVEPQAAASEVASCR